MEFLIEKVLAAEVTKTVDLSASISNPPGVLEQIIDTVVETIVETVKNIIDTVVGALAPIIDKIVQVVGPVIQVITQVADQLLDTIAQVTAPVAPIAQAISTPAAVATAVAVATAAAAPTVITALTTQSLGQILLQLFRAIADRFLNFLTVIGLRKKRPPWGVIFNAATDEPVGGALVRLFESENYKLIATHVTDDHGRYGFLVKPGRYYVTVTKFGYLFPVNRRIVTSYGDIYKGEPLTVQEGKVQSFRANIPMDPQEKAYKPKKWLSLALNYLRALRLPLLIFGTIMSIIAYANYRTTINGLLVLLYLLLWILEYYTRKVKTWSEAFEAATLKEAKGALIKVFNLTSNRLIYTEKVAGGGQLEVILPPGEYMVKGELIGYGFPSKEVPVKAKLRFRNIYQGEKIIIKKTSPLVIGLPFARLTTPERSDGGQEKGGEKLS